MYDAYDAVVEIVDSEWLIVIKSNGFTRDKKDIQRKGSGCVAGVFPRHFYIITVSQRKEGECATRSCARPFGAPAIAAILL